MKKIRGAEVNVNQLTEQKKKEFDEAKEAEISQWLCNEAVRRASTEVDSARCICMRWVLTLKETGKAKARIVLLGYEDPDARTGTITSASTTMSMLQFKVCRSWRALKGDVKAAFLQGSASEAGRSFFARPLPELSRAMGLKEGVCADHEELLWSYNSTSFLVRRRGRHSGESWTGTVGNRSLLLAVLHEWGRWCQGNTRTCMCSCGRFHCHRQRAV